MTTTYTMTLAKATPADFKTMWKVHKLLQSYGYQFTPEDDDPRAVRMKDLLMARLDQQLGTGGFTRVVMGCQMLIKQVCDPTQDHVALKPVYGAAPEMLEALQAILPFIPKTSAAEGGASMYSANVIAADMVRAAIANATGEAP